MFDVIIVGAATRDIFIEVNSTKNSFIHPGAKIDIEKPFIQTGGGATNTSVGFSRLGLKVATVCKVGHDDPGHLIKRNLENEKVNTKFVIEDKNIGTALSLIFSSPNTDRTVFVYRGASDEINLKDIKLNLLKTKWLHITALKDNSIKILKPLLDYAVKNKIKISINPGSQELEIKSLFKYIDVLLLNKEEAEKLSGTKDNINGMIKYLMLLGPKTIVITGGENRAFVYSNNQIYSAVPPKVKIKNTLGAGDAFCSGFVSALIKNKSVEEAFRLGLLNSSSVIQHIGAKVGLLHKNDINLYERKLNAKLQIHKGNFSLW